MRDRLPLALSTAALLVAVLGTPLGNAAFDAVVPKNSVGAAQLRNGAVTNAKLRGDAVTSGKVKNRSLKAVDFALGQLPSGPPGPKGEQGQKGDAGPSGVSNYELVRASSPSNSDFVKLTSADCPKGKRVLGGGAVITGAYDQGVSFGYSTPYNVATDDRSGYIARAYEVNPVAGNWAIDVYAVCANVSA